MVFGDVLDPPEDGGGMEAAVGSAFVGADAQLLGVFVHDAGGCRGPASSRRDPGGGMGLCVMAAPRGCGVSCIPVRGGGCRREFWRGRSSG